VEDPIEPEPGVDQKSRKSPAKWGFSRVQTGALIADTADVGEPHEWQKMCLAA
jgi:hypothetical protein